MKKPLPIGVDFFRKVRQRNYYYVDKTLFIADFLRYQNEVTLITRPRRFGKTLNLDTVREFLDIELDSRAIFSGLNIMNTEYAGEINTRPVLAFSFKDCKGNRESLLTSLKYALYQECKRCEKIPLSLDARTRQDLTKLLDSFSVETSSLAVFQHVIRFLCEIVSEHYQKPVILLIDEYDTPMTAAYEAGCYPEFRDFFRTLYGTALKGNRYLDQAIITGIQRIAKENIFSDLNNLEVCDATSEKYSDYFGFTENEVKELLSYYEVPFTDEVRLMYDGYRFGNSEIYNPWSLVNYAEKKELVAYWVNTSGSRLISKNIAAASPAFIAAFDKLVLEGKTSVAINLRSGTYEGMNDESLWGLLVSAGYLTFAEKPSGNPTDMQVLRFPNGDVRQDFQRIVAERQARS